MKFYDMRLSRIFQKLIDRPVLGPALLPVYSLFLKFFKAEGVLLFVNLSLLLLHKRSEPEILVTGVAFSALVLAQLYGFNDAMDAPNDLKDPDKLHELAASILARRRAFLIGSAIWAAALLILSRLFLPDAHPGVFAMILINTLYSAFFKGIPVVDVIVVTFWGACFPLVSGMNIPLDLLAMIGCMTGISHVWQTVRDARSDAKVGIKTVAVFSKFWSLGIVVILSAILSALTAIQIGGKGGAVAAVTCALPIVFYRFIPQIRIVWLLSKVLFALLWLANLRLINL